MSRGGDSVSPDQEEYREDEERDEFASRSIFAAGWFRAVLVLTVLAIVVVISLPYLLNWFEPAPPPKAAKSSESPAPAPSATTPPGSPSPATPPSSTEGKAAPGAADKGAAPKAGPGSGAAPKASSDKAALPAKPAPEKMTAEKAPAEKAPAAKAPAEKPAPAKVAAEKPAPAPKTSTDGASAQAKAPEKSAAATKVAKAEPPAKSASAPASKPAEATGAKYWIQLGAFKEQQNADALAKALRDSGFPVQVSPITRDLGDGKSGGQHELFVADASVEKVTAALKGRGTAQTVSGGVAVKPAFSLDEAMTVSKRLTAEGLKVVIRPVGGIGGGTTTLHAVRAGSYPNRTSALAARDELVAKGHTGFLTESPAR